MKNEIDFTVWYMFEQGMTYIWNIMKFEESGKVLDGYVRNGSEMKKKYFKIE